MARSETLQAFEALLKTCNGDQDRLLKVLVHSWIFVDDFNAAMFEALRTDPLFELESSDRIIAGYQLTVLDKLLRKAVLGKVVGSKPLTAGVYVNESFNRVYGYTKQDLHKKTNIPQPTLQNILQKKLYRFVDVYSLKENKRTNVYCIHEQGLNLLIEKYTSIMLDTFEHHTPQLAQAFSQNWFSKTVLQK